MYKVIKDFGDIEDNYYMYREGDIYPRKGVEATEERCKYLASDKNLMSTPLIKAVKGTKK